MANVNKVILIGNLTKEIDLRKTPKGTSVAETSLAINRSRTDDSGQRIEETTYVDITLWGRTAEVAHQYTGKGQPLYVEGRLQMDSWVDKTTGKNRSRLKVVAETIQFLGNKSTGGGGGGAVPHRSGSQTSPPQGQAGGSPAQIKELEADEIPF